MAQATRCPHCQTAFRVVRDQLLLREGWVRCGNCGKPFNALDHLFDFSPTAAPHVPQRAAPNPASEPAEPTAAPTAAPEPTDSPAQPAAAAAGSALDWRQPSADDPSGWEGRQSTAPGEEIEPVNAPEDTSVDPGPDTAVLPARSDEEPLSMFDLNAALGYRFAPDDTATADGAPEQAGARTPADEPEFVRQAQRRARWRSPAVRALLAVLSLLLLALLAAQAALFWRDTLAQRWPATRPWLQQLCDVTTGCTIAAPRDLDALVIDASALTPTPDGLQLSVLLRNRAGRAVAWPALELTLTDVQGRIQQRKVIEPRQYLAASPSSVSTLRAGIAPEQQAALRLRLVLGTAAPAGYKLLLFYP